MKRLLFSALIILNALQSFYAQERGEEINQILADKLLFITTKTQITDVGSGEQWEAKAARSTIAGKEVILRLEGQNLIVFAQFTPYPLEDGGYLMVAQAQVWIGDAEGVSYNSAFQTLPLNIGETVMFFPLGFNNSENIADIQIHIRLDNHQTKQEREAATAPPSDSETNDSTTNAAEQDE
jgi:hypothetical protein